MLLVCAHTGDTPIDFARLHWPGATEQQFLDSSRAEFLVDLVTRADRQGQGHLLADAYDKSQLCQVRSTDAHRDTDSVMGMCLASRGLLINAHYMLFRPLVPALPCANLS